MSTYSTYYQALDRVNDFLSARGWGKPYTDEYEYTLWEKGAVSVSLADYEEGHLVLVEADGMAQPVAEIRYGDPDLLTVLAATLDRLGA